MSLDWLDRDVTTGTYLWRLEREDGVALGFASHDRDLVIDGFRYRATPGMVPSSIALSDSLDIDNVEISGVVTSAAIAETDLDAGRWDGALLYISLVDWEQPDVEPLPLICGEFGEIVRSGDSFTVEMLGATSFLDEPIAPLTSPTCRAEFCDRQCKLSLHRHQREGRVSLADQPVQPVAPGARVLLTEGCNKNFATCRDRFANSFNFRGEPYLPGNDLLTRYRGA